MDSHKSKDMDDSQRRDRSLSTSEFISETVVGTLQSVFEEAKKYGAFAIQQPDISMGKIVEYVAKLEQDGNIGDDTPLLFTLKRLAGNIEELTTINKKKNNEIVESIHGDIEQYVDELIQQFGADFPIKRENFINYLESIGREHIDTLIHVMFVILNIIHFSSAHDAFGVGDFEDCESYADYAKKIDEVKSRDDKLEELPKDEKMKQYARFFAALFHDLGKKLILTVSHEEASSEAMVRKVVLARKAVLTQLFKDKKGFAMAVHDHVQLANLLQIGEAEAMQIAKPLDFIDLEKADDEMFQLMGNAMNAGMLYQLSHHLGLRPTPNGVAGYGPGIAKQCMRMSLQLLQQKDITQLHPVLTQLLAQTDFSDESQSEEDIAQKLIGKFKDAGVITTSEPQKDEASFEIESFAEEFSLMTINQIIADLFTAVSEMRSYDPEARDSDRDQRLAKHADRLVSETLFLDKEEVVEYLKEFRKLGAEYMLEKTHGTTEIENRDEELEYLKTKADFYHIINIVFYSSIEKKHGIPLTPSIQYMCVKFIFDTVKARVPLGEKIGKQMSESWLKMVDSQDGVEHYVQFREGLIAGDQEVLHANQNVDESLREGQVINIETLIKKLESLKNTAKNNQEIQEIISPLIEEISKLNKSDASFLTALMDVVSLLNQSRHILRGNDFEPSFLACYESFRKILKNNLSRNIDVYYDSISHIQNVGLLSSLLANAKTIQLEITSLVCTFPDAKDLEDVDNKIGELFQRLGILKEMSSLVSNIIPDLESLERLLPSRVEIVETQRSILGAVDMRVKRIHDSIQKAS